MTTTPYRDYLFGLIISIALAWWLAFLGLTAALTPDLGWGIVALLTAAIWVGGPLAILLIIVWFYYLSRDRGRVPGRVHAWLFLPTLIAMLIYRPANRPKNPSASALAMRIPILPKRTSTSAAKICGLTPRLTPPRRLVQSQECRLRPLNRSGSWCSIDIPARPRPSLFRMTARACARISRSTDIFPPRAMLSPHRCR